MNPQRRARFVFNAEHLHVAQSHQHLTDAYRVNFHRDPSHSAVCQRRFWGISHVQPRTLTPADSDLKRGEPVNYVVMRKHKRDEAVTTTAKPNTSITASNQRHGDRGEQGLTTLEWLLIVAAIAGLAALAVVLVQTVVNDTAESVESQDARDRAADIATTEIHQDWVNADPQSLEEANEINRKYRSRCQHYSIIYADVSDNFEFKDGKFDPNGGWRADPGCTIA